MAPGHQASMATRRQRDYPVPVKWDCHFPVHKNVRTLPNTLKGNEMFQTGVVQAQMSLPNMFVERQAIPSGLTLEASLPESTKLQFTNKQGHIPTPDHPGV